MEKARIAKPAALPRAALPSRGVWIIATVLLGLLVAFGLAAIVFMLCPMLPTPTEPCAVASVPQFTGLCCAVHRNPPWVLFSGIAAAPAVILTWWWRTRHKDEDLRHKDEENDLARRQERSTRFHEAIKLLADDKLEARLGALYSLEALGRDAPSELRRIVETISAFLRERGQAGDPNDRLFRQPVDVQAALTIVARIGSGGADEPVEVDLRNARLQGIEARAASLPDARLEGADLRFAILDQASLPRAKLVGAVLSGASLRDADLHDADASRANMGGANLTGADLRSGVFVSVDFDGAKLDSCKLDGAKFELAHMASVTLLNASLERVNWRGADLSGASPNPLAPRPPSGEE